jgi:tyrosine-protein kinase Etk/Wzc
MVEEEDQMETMFDFNNPMNSKTILNEIEIVKSRNLAEKLIQKIMNSPYKKNLYILGTREYHSNATEIKKTIKRLIPFYEEEKKNEKEININDIVQNIRENGLMSISNRRETNILDISFKSVDSLEAIYLVNQFVEAYREADISWSSEEITNLNEFLVEQLETSKEELTKAENKLQAYQKEEVVFGVEEEIKPILEQATKAETELTNTITEIKIALDKKAYLEGQLSEKEKELAKKISSSIETKLEALRQELYIKEGELIRTRKTGGIKHEATQDLERDIANIRQELENETNKMIGQGLSVANPLEYSQELLEKGLAIDAELSGLRAKQKELEKVTRHYNNRLSALPEKQLQYVRLERDRKVLQESYLFLRTKMEEAKIKKASESGKVRIIDRAAVAEKISPKKKQDLLLGIVLGLGLGVGFALLLDFMDNTIRTIDDIERTGATLLGVIPYIGDANSKKYGRGKKGKISVKKLQRESSIIAHLDPKSPVAEAYRVVRTNINMASFEDDTKTILLSSPGPGEGKTTTISNLGITYANLGRKTLIVDADLRKPRIHTVFSLDNSEGMVQVLVQDRKPMEVIKPHEDIENLFILTSGGVPPNPSELLGSKKMKAVINILKENFDVILFDTPPFTAVTDPVMLAKEVDKNFLVVKAGQTNKNAYYRAVQNLKNIDAATSGVIINWLSKSTSHDANYYYQNYYRYYND